MKRPYTIPTNEQFIANCKQINRLEAKTKEAQQEKAELLKEPLTPKGRTKSHIKDRLVALSERFDLLNEQARVFRDQNYQYTVGYILEHFVKPQVKSNLTTDSVLSPLLVTAFESGELVVLTEFGEQVITLKVYVDGNCTRIEVDRRNKDKRYGHNLVTIRRSTDYDYDVRKEYRKKLLSDANITLTESGVINFDLDHQSGSTQPYVVEVNNLGQIKVEEVGFITGLLSNLSIVANHLNNSCNVEALNFLAYWVASEASGKSDNLIGEYYD